MAVGRAQGLALGTDDVRDACAVTDEPDLKLLWSSAVVPECINRMELALECGGESKLIAARLALGLAQSGELS